MDERILYLKNSGRWPKEEVTPVSVPKVQVTNEEWNKAVGVLEKHDGRIDTAELLVRDRVLNAATVGYTGTTKQGKVMALEDGDIVWNDGGATTCVCAQFPVSQGDILYLPSYYIGGYPATTWAIVNTQGTVLQHGEKQYEAFSTTEPERIESTANGTLLVYMQYNVGLPVLKKITEGMPNVEKTDNAVSTVATFDTIEASATIQTGVYIDNVALEKGTAADALFEGGNTNNGVYSLTVQKGDVIKIVNANLGGYGNAYWTLENTEGIVQRMDGTGHSVSAEQIVVMQASGTLHVSFGFYDSTTEKYVRPSLYKVADLNARQDGVAKSLSDIYQKTLLQVSENAVTVGSKYIAVEDGVLEIHDGGNTNNGYMTLQMVRGQYARVKGAASSAFANVAWVLTNTNGKVLEWSGHIDYRTLLPDFDVFAPEDGVLYVGFGVYDEDTEEWLKPTIEVIANSGAAIERHEESITETDKALFKQVVEFDGYDAPKVIRYNNSNVLILDTSVGNVYFRCCHLSVHKGEKYMVRGASTGGYDGLAWAIFANGTAVQQSAKDTKANTVFEDCFVEVEQDGVLWVNNFRTVDDENCELYKLSSAEFDGNLGTKAIVLCGDSTSQGLGEALEGSMLKNPRRIYRMGVGSENVMATAARMGAIPCMVMPVTIPAAATAVQVSTTPRILFKQGYGSDGVPTTPTVQNAFVSPMFVETAHFYCSIAGVDGDLYTNATDGYTYFLRSSAGSAVTLKEPTEVVPLKVQRVRNSLLVCLMGTNGGYLNYNADYVADNDLRGDQTDEQRAQNLFDVMKRMFAYMGGEMVVIGFFCGELPTYYTKAFYEKYESLCEHEFGERFINARLWLKDYAWQEMGLTLTSTDKQYMAAGYPPVQLFDDNQAVHLKTATNAVFAQYVADRISHLGY